MAEAHLYVNIKPTFIENYLEANIDLFDVLDISKERTSFRVKKTSTLAEFKVRSALFSARDLTNSC